VQITLAPTVQAITLTVLPVCFLRLMVRQCFVLRVSRGTLNWQMALAYSAAQFLATVRTVLSAQIIAIALSA
jgi:hypothetical protein